VNKIQQKKAAGTKSGKTETSQNSFVAERQKRNPRISKKYRLELYFERQKLDFSLKIGWRAISQLAVCI